MTTPPPTTRRSRAVHLTLLAALGAALSACAEQGPEYTRTSFSGQDPCLNAYRQIPGLTTPCVQEGGRWFGPYTYGSGDVHYLGYSPVGELLTAGIIYNLATRQRSYYQEPRAKSLVRAVVARPFTPAGSGGFPSGGAARPTPVRPAATPVTAPGARAPSPVVRAPASPGVSRGGFGSSARSSVGVGG